MEVDWHVAIRPSKRRTLNPAREVGRLLDKAEHLKTSVGAKVEHFSTGQAGVRLVHDELPGPGEEHGAAGDAVRAGQPVDGATPSPEITGMSASEMQQEAGAGSIFMACDVRI